LELPSINQVYNELSPNHENLQVVAVEINNDRAGADTFIQENGLNFTFSEADRAFVKKHFNTAGYPNSFIIDQEGIIREHKLGFRNGDEITIKNKLLELLTK
jgi:peroxiredoxin